MTTTNIVGRIRTNAGLFTLQAEPTDAAGESELKILDLTNSLKSLKDVIYGQVITDIDIQASDGSILTSANIYGPGGVKLHSLIGGERLASSPEVWNISLHGVQIPVTESTMIKIVVND